MSANDRNKWTCVCLFSLAVGFYLIFDLLDLAPAIRQVAIFPVCFLERIICAGSTKGVLELDTDIRGTWATAVRVLAFGFEVALVLYPGYSYVKTRKKSWLFLAVLAIVWIIIGLAYFLLALLGMSGMMD